MDAVITAQHLEEDCGVRALLGFLAGFNIIQKEMSKNSLLNIITLWPFPTLMPQTSDSKLICSLERQPCRSSQLLWIWLCSDCTTEILIIFWWCCEWVQHMFPSKCQWARPCSCSFSLPKKRAKIMQHQKNKTNWHLNLLHRNSDTDYFVSLKLLYFHSISVQLTL